MSNIIKEEEMKDSNMDIELVKYIEDEIFPLYNRNEEGHGIQHIKTVIKRSLELAKNYEVNLNMVYTIASYHDLGHYIDRKTHEIISANWMWNDENLDKFFTRDQKQIIKEAIEDHRSSNKNVPRNIYGKILASADKNTNVTTFLERTLAFGFEHYKDFTYKEQIDRAYDHAEKKFGKNGYAVNKYYVKDDKYERYLKELQDLIENKEEFYKKAENILKQMI